MIGPLGYDIPRDLIKRAEEVNNSVMYLVVKILKT
jgi:hypothetical protein